MEKLMKIRINAPKFLVVENRPVPLSQFTEDEIRQYCQEVQTEMLAIRAQMVQQIEAAKAKQ